MASGVAPDSAKSKQLSSGAVCEAPRRVCDDACIDPSAHREHCGGCGEACETNQRCVDSRCVRAPAQGEGDPCDPAKTYSCGKYQRCDEVDDTCVDCGPGEANCNGGASCEPCASEKCRGTRCEVITATGPRQGDPCDGDDAFVCGGDDWYCSLTDGCQPCESGRRNCDGLGACDDALEVCPYGT